MNRRTFLCKAGTSLGFLMYANGCRQVNSTATRQLDSARFGLVGYWPLHIDALDKSGLKNHGRMTLLHKSNKTVAGFGNYIEIPANDSLNLGNGDFTISVWIWTPPEPIVGSGDILSQYDPQKRRGFNLYLKSSAGGYSSHGDDRHVFFGLDDAQISPWEDCGRPNPTSNYISNSLTVYNGDLYAAITDAQREEDWSHVYRYCGGQKWQDCGRVGKLKARGVGPMIVHGGNLYAASWNYDWTRVGIRRPRQPVYEADFCRIYRYEDETHWEDCGQPGNCRRLFGLASYRGRLYVTAEDGRCYAYDGGQKWIECGRFPNYGHPIYVHHDKLYVGVLNPAGVWEYDGANWKQLGNPQGHEDICDQIHSFHTYRGQLHATTWPLGHVMRFGLDGQWADCGRLGDALEINGLVVYNGKLYGGSIPRSEVFRYDEGTDWKSVGRFLNPADYQFNDPKEWARVTSLTTFQGKLFASMGSCTSSHLDAPADFRGKVFCTQAGQCLSYEKNIGYGWKHVSVIRHRDRLELFIEGRKVAETTAFPSFNITNNQPLRIAFGESDYFNGKIREVRIYRRTLKLPEITQLALKIPFES